MLARRRDSAARDIERQMKIAWIASYAKSGSTWMRLFLSRLHAGENWTANDVASRIPYFLEFAKPAQPFPLADTRDPEKMAAMASTWLPLQADIRRSLGGDAPGSIPVKTHNANVEIAGHPFTSPEHCDRALHILRDPRDVAASLCHHIDRSLPEVVRMMTDRSAIVIPEDGMLPEVWSDWATHSQSWRRFADGPVESIRYEDMIADPSGAFQRALALLGWRYDAGAIAAAIDAVSFAQLQAAEARDGFIEAPPGRAFFRRGVVGGWRDHPEQDQFRRLEDAFAEEMTAFGYR